MSKQRANYIWIAVLVLATILVGSLSVTPQLLIKQAVEATGRTFVLNQFLRLHDGGDGYFQFAREVADGHFPPADLFFDYSSPGMYPSLPPLILGFFISLFGDITNGYLTALFVIPAILFLLFYGIGLIIFERTKLWSLFFGLIGILTPVSLVTTEAFLGLTNFSNIVLKNFYPGIKTLLPLLFYSRADHPLLTTIPYLAAIASFLLFWQKSIWAYSILAGFTAGLLFYTYFHIWVYWAVVLVLVFLYCLFRLRKTDWPRLRNTGLLVATTAVVSIPYFINYFALKAVPGGEDLIDRIGLEIGRNFTWQVWPAYIIYATAAVLVYWTMWRVPERRLRAVLYFCAIAAAFIIWNIQLVIGYVPHSDHWPRAINPILFVIVLDIVYCGYKDWKYSKKAQFILAIMLVLSSLLILKKVINAAMFISPNQETLKNYVLPEDVLTAYRWMDQNLNEPKVISPSLLTSIYISAYTSARPFLPWGQVTSISNFDMEERFLAANKLFNVDPKILGARLRDGAGLICRDNCDQAYAISNLADARTYLYQNYFITPENPRDRRIPEYKIRELLDRYQKFFVSFKDVEADYVFYGPWERDFSQISLHGLSNLELVYRNEAVEVYNIK